MWSYHKAITSIILFLISGFFLLACSPQGDTERPETKFPPFEPGKGHAWGIVHVDYKPKKDLYIYFSRIVGGRKVIINRPNGRKFDAIEPVNYNDRELLGVVAKTDEWGRWAAFNLEPGRYCFSPEKWSDLKQSSNLGIVLEKHIFNIKQGSITNFGKVNYKWDRYNHNLIRHPYP